jgi:hypothetical protein
MILDNNLMLGSLTHSTFGSAGTHDFPDVVDLQSNTAYTATASGGVYTVAQGSQIRDIGEGTDLYVVFTVTTTFAGGTSATFQAVVDSTDDLDTSPKVVGETGAVPLASLTIGAQVVVRINPQQALGSAAVRYLGANMVTAGTHTAGAVRADVVLDIQDGKRNYASGFVVS